MTDENHDDDSLDQYKERSLSDVMDGVEPYEKAENLQALYHDRGWSQREIADFYDVDQSTISRTMNEVDVETRKPMHLRTPSLSKSVREDGYVRFIIANGDGGQDSLYRHQLVALLATKEGNAWAFSASEVFSPRTQIHHEMASSIALDVPVNLDVVGAREHVHIHSGTGVTSDDVERVLSEMREWPSENGVEITYENYREDVDEGSVEMEDSGEDTEASAGTVAE